MPTLQVQSWPVDQLVPYQHNARTHSDKQIAQIMASIQEFGWTNPILIGSDHVVIAGHARLAAARKLNLAEVPVIELAHLSEAQRRALVIADNQLALNAGWDEELLRAELRGLQDQDFDLDVVGFDTAELDRLLAIPEEEDRADATPPLPDVAVSRPVTCGCWARTAVSTASCAATPRTPTPSPSC